MKFSYTPSGVCSRHFDITLDDNNVIESMNIEGGCNGNLKGITSLAKGMKAEDFIEKCRGITCGFRNTSCPDQIATALEKMLEES